MKTIKISLIVALFIFSSSVYADEPVVYLRPSLLVGQIDGTLGAGGQESDLSLGWGNALQKGNGAINLDGEYRGDLFLGLTELSYTALSDTEATLVNSASTIDQANLEGFFIAQHFGVNIYNGDSGYLDLTGGARFSSISNELIIRNNNAETSLEESKSWITPLIGLNARFQISPATALLLSGNWGGLSGADNKSWQVSSSLGFLLSKTSRFLLGYRGTSATYSSNDFLYDVVIHGPTVGFEFGL